MKLFSWIKDIKETNQRLKAIEIHLGYMTGQLDRIRKKVGRKHRTFAEIERQRSRKRHPRRH